MNLRPAMDTRWRHWKGWCGAIFAASVNAVSNTNRRAGRRWRLPRGPAALDSAVTGARPRGAARALREVATERDRLVDHIQVAQSQPAHLARTALLKRMYGRHPYAVQTPEAAQVKAVRPAQLRALHGDRVRLLQVVQNLLDNAVKFLGEQPQPRVEIGARAGTPAVLYVRDNGAGI